jgi:hypothetical protein
MMGRASAGDGLPPEDHPRSSRPSTGQMSNAQSMGRKCLLVFALRQTSWKTMMTVTLTRCTLRKLYPCLALPCLFGGLADV